MRKTLFSLLTLFVVASFLLAACQTPAATETQPAETSPAETAPAGAVTEPTKPAATAPETQATKAVPETPAASGAAVKISIWHGYIETEEKLFSQTVTDFMTANPNITIDLLAVPFDQLQNKFQTEAASGGGPTIIMGPQDRMAGYATADLLAEIDGSAAFLKDLVPASVEGGKVNGKLVGVPVNNKVVAMVYNKSKVTTEPKDFDELLTMAADNGLAITADWFHNYMWGPAFGAKFFDENNKVVIDSPEGAEAYAYFKKVCESKGVTCDSNDGDMDTLFRQGEAAFRIQGPWASGDFIADLGADNVGVMAIPTIPGKAAPRPWNQSEMASLNVNATPEEVTAAMKFIEYLTSADVQAKFLNEANWIPANASVDTASNPVVGGFLAQVPNSDPFPVVPELGATWDPMGNAMTQILEGVAEPQAALTEAANLINTTNNKQ
ncbi:MAG TPA: extracellular solute-binding protein [Anaerolineaceae bacterium]|nr:extracellular solute-binding protein [Anaerolineaceae bacterium]